MDLKHLPRAHNMSVAFCSDNDCTCQSIGIVMWDRNSKAFAVGAFDPKTARAFAADIIDAANKTEARSGSRV